MPPERNTDTSTASAGPAAMASSMPSSNARGLIEAAP